MIHLSYAKSFLGKPYKWGGDTPLAGFDCSGFVQEVFASIGMAPPIDMNAQGLYHYYLKLGTGALKAAGALAFFGKSVDHITHAAIMIGEHLMIEAGGGDSDTIDLESATKKKAFIRIRPIRKDLVAVIMPKYPDWAWNGKA